MNVRLDPKFPEVRTRPWSAAVATLLLLASLPWFYPEADGREEPRACETAAGPAGRAAEHFDSWETQRPEPVLLGHQHLPDTVSPAALGSDVFLTTCLWTRSGAVRSWASGVTVVHT